MSRPLAIACLVIGAVVFGASVATDTTLWVGVVGAIVGGVLIGAGWSRLRPGRP